MKIGGANFGGRRHSDPPLLFPEVGWGPNRSIKKGANEPKSILNGDSRKKMRSECRKRLLPGKQSIIFLLDLDHFWN
jgi:hypothetical protein